jgi:3-hydroxymyristoyl/3-hydroxydecanoyl-(acyl carrier protein) dehydratase
MTTLPHYHLHLTHTSPDRTLIEATATFSPDFLAFQGHFPENPILPGFFHIQLALESLRLAGLPAQLHEIPSAKFTHPIPPDVPVTITIQRHPTHYNATLHAGTTLCSTFDFSIT